jgi:hypothetical protein
LDWKILSPKMIAKVDMNIDYEPQIIEDFDLISGDEKYNKILS